MSAYGIIGRLSLSFALFVAIRKATCAAVIIVVRMNMTSIPALPAISPIAAKNLRSAPPIESLLYMSLPRPHTARTSMIPTPAPTNGSHHTSLNPTNPIADIARRMLS